MSNSNSNKKIVFLPLLIALCISDSNSAGSRLDSKRKSSGGAAVAASGHGKTVLFGSKAWLTVRNEEGSFFLCQASGKVYENARQCRIQWLEGENEKNLYVWGSMDSIDPSSIITSVNVKKLPSGKCILAIGSFCLFSLSIHNEFISKKLF